MAWQAVLTCRACGDVPQAADHRHRGGCVRCGRRLVLTPRVTELHRHGTLDFGHHPDLRAEPVNLDLQRQFVREAARAVGIDPSALLAYTETRTLPGPLKEFWVRPWVQEARDEISDATNYIPWEAQRIIALGDARGLAHLGRAIALLLTAWHELDLYEEARLAD